jgi:hypothetical protein
MSFIEYHINNIQLQLTKKLDDAIKSSLEKHSIDISDKNVVKYLLLINFEEDKEWLHLYYKYGTLEEIRIFSYEKQPTISTRLNDMMQVVFTADIKFY